MQPEEHEKMHRVETRHFWFRGTRRVILAALARSLGRERLSRARVLDLGCGTGLTLSLLPPGARAVGVDFSPAALRFARGRAGHAELLRASAYALPLADRAFDAVLALDVLEHLDDDRAAARELLRVLAPDGVAIVTVPAFRELWSEHDVALEHRRRYRLAEIEAVLRDAGFTIEHASYYNFFLFPLVAAARIAGRARTALGAGRPATGLSVPAGPVNAVLTAILGSEGMLAPRLRLPIGVSCLVVARPA